MIKQTSVIDIAPNNFIDRVKMAEWHGGTTVYRNSSLYRSHDYYRGGRTISTDPAQADRYPNAIVSEVTPNNYLVEDL